MESSHLSSVSHRGGRCCDDIILVCDLYSQMCVSRTIERKTQSRNSQQTLSDLKMSSRGASLEGLPTELRLLIWQLTLQDSECHIRRGREKKKPSRSIWALLHVNQQIRAEVLPMFFPLVTIHLREDLTESNLSTWLDIVGLKAVSEMKKTHLYSKRMCAGSRPDE